MGYYCDVLFVMNENAHKTFLKEIEELKEINKQTYDYIQDIFKHAHIVEKDGDYLYQINQIKWHTLHIGNNGKILIEINNPERDDPTYELHKTLMSLEDSEFLYFIVGEEIEDIEICGNYWENKFNASIVRDFYYEE